MSTNSCATRIAQNILNDTCVPYGKGVERRGWIIPKDNIDYEASGEVSSNTLANIVLRSGVYGFTMTMATSGDAYSGLAIASQEVMIGASFTKTVPVKLLHNSKESAKNVEAMMLEKHVVILENLKKRNETDATEAFIVIGWENGCVGQEASYDAYSDDTMGGWSINLVETSATKGQVFFDAGGYEATITKLNALLEPVTP